jgi:hypothetical protein
MVMNGIGYTIPKFRIVKPKQLPCFIGLELDSLFVVLMETGDKIKLEQCQ